MVWKRAFVGMAAVFLVFGLTAATWGAPGPTVEEHRIVVAVEEATWLHIEGGGVDVHFTVGVSPDGAVRATGAFTDINVRYSSIVPEGQGRALTAELLEALPDGLDLFVEAYITRPGDGEPGAVRPPLRLDVEPQALITDIGSVQQARARISYSIIVDNLDGLWAGNGLEATVRLTLTPAE